MFDSEREAFSILKRAVESDTELAQNIEASFEEILRRYSTSIYENRFLVGGVSEIILAAAFGAAGLQAEHIAHSSTREDIILSNGARLSVKGLHSRKARTFNIINTQGATTVEWASATVFPVSGYGLIYADPELLPDATHKGSDALQLEWAKLRTFADGNSGCVIKLAIPFSSSGERSEVASRDVAEKILKSKPRLKDHIPQKEQIR